MTEYEISCVIVWAYMNIIVSALSIFIMRTVLKFPEFRKGLVQGIQDNDNAFHAADIDRTIFRICGLVSANFTMNIVGVCFYHKMFDIGPIAVITLFIGVTFTLFGIAWKKP